MTAKRTFENLSVTPQFAEGYGIPDVFKAMMRRPKDHSPSAVVPVVRTDLKNFYSKDCSLIWFGHSSYLLHANGFNILVDPVLSGHASPVSFMIKAFQGTDIYKASDMPEIDLLILTHNHYDHLDYKALKQLAPQVKRMVVPAGVSADLRGIPFQCEITELDWWQQFELSNDLQITSTPARHFSGRGLVRNRSLWASYVLQFAGLRIFIGGDSGYDSHFKTIGEKHGPFDLVLLECGQYDKMWPYIHSTPEELVAEAAELRAEVTLPVHWGKFALANHGWKEPIERFVTAADAAGLNYVLPKIGEPFTIKGALPKEKWWRY